MTPEERAYAAGIVDGEGSIFVTARLLKQYRTHNEYRHAEIWVKVSSTSGVLMKWFLDHCGGSVSIYVPKKKPSHKPQGTWHLASRKAESFLREIRPFLIIKAAQADNALACRELSTSRKRHSTRPVTDDEWAAFQAFVGRSHELNKGDRMTNA